jgi:DNA-binding transcriptional LysR family regulator
LPNLLTHASALDDRALALRRGDIEVLRVAASSEPIEGVFPTFLHMYALRHPAVRLVLIEADAADHLKMLERGEVDLAANVINVIQVDAHRFASYLLPQFHVMAACTPSRGLPKSDTIDIRRLVEHPLLLPKASFATRILFDAACRLAGVRPDIFIESVSSHALLALAEADHGVAVVPSIMRPGRRPLQVMRVTHKREPLRILPAILWDKRRTLPRYAEGFSELLSAHILGVFARSQPSQTKDRPARHTRPSGGS